MDNLAKIRTTRSFSGFPDVWYNEGIIQSNYGLVFNYINFINLHKLFPVSLFIFTII